MRRLLAGVALLALSAPVAAQPAAAPAIQRTALDVEAGVLTITGTGLGADVVVLVEGRPAVVLPGATDTEVRVVAPESVLVTAGAFRVVVGDPSRRLDDGFVVLSPGGRSTNGLAVERGPAVPGPEARVARPSLNRLDASGTPSVGIGPSLIENSANTAVGLGALVSATTGNYNAALGYTALYGNTTGSFNTASGNEALRVNTTGFYNTATGHTALYGNTTGHWNTASGVGALANNSSGANNAAFGFQAGANATTGSFNVFLGSNVYGTAADTNTMRLGLPYNGVTGAGQNRTFVAGIYGTQLTSPAQQVFVDVNGQLGIMGPPVATGGGTLSPGALPRAIQDRLATLEQLVRDQAAVLADQASALSAMRDRLSVLEGQRVGRR
ncbi:MAG: hypothetical protein R2745_19860 [Vicinamibacterales bacterium]